MAMKPTIRLLWICLLLHAGRVGCPMNLTLTFMKRSFNLHQSLDFQPLIDQGFITLLHDRTGQDIKENPLLRKGQKKAAGSHEYPGIKPTKKTPPKPTPKPAPEQLDIPPISLHLEAWQEWIEFRRKAGFRKYKTNKSRDHLATYSRDAQRAAVTESVTQQWQGLFPAKHEARHNGNNQAIGRGRKLTFDEIKAIQYADFYPQRTADDPNNSTDEGSVVASH